MSKRGSRGRGQSTVEMLLVLPAFLGIVFTIMEFGNVAFQTVILNHAAWEAARIASMYACGKGARQGGCSPNPQTGMMQGIMTRIIPGGARIVGKTDATVYDGQAGVQNYDLVATASYAVPLIFPISNFFLSRPLGSGTREVSVTVRVPIEQPLPK